MFGSNILDVIIGLCFLFAFLSVVASTTNELFQIALKSRSKDLNRGIRDLVGCPQKPTLLRSLLSQFWTKPVTRLAEFPEGAQIFSKPSGAQREAIRVATATQANTTASNGCAAQKIKDGQGPRLPYDPPITWTERWNTLRNVCIRLCAAVVSEKAKGNLSETSDNAEYFVNLIYTHGLVNSLYKGSYDGDTSKLPSYIPSANFAMAFIAAQEFYSLYSRPLPSNIQQVSDSFSRKYAVESPAYQAAIETWYNTTMDRVAGGYKRRVQHFLFWIGLCLAVMVNADVSEVSQKFSKNSGLQNLVVEAGKARAKYDANPNVEDAMTKIGNYIEILSSTGFPMGWKYQYLSDVQDSPCGACQMPQPSTASVSGSALRISKHSLALNKEEDVLILDRKKSALENGWSIVRQVFSVAHKHLAGWLLAAVAISMGAPFWFDLVDKSISLRSTVKPDDDPVATPAKPK